LFEDVCKILKGIKNNVWLKRYNFFNLC
jgi:hypothetical protein